MPPPPFPTPAHHSLEGVPASSDIRKIYPKDYFPNPGTVHLPLGNTGYWLLGPENGPKVVLVHGISTPSLMWKYLAPALADNGFRVLAYDLYGRGYSEAPDTAYDANLYITQLALLLQHVRFSSAHIIGLSMGGGITATFAATFPNLVSGKVVFIASAGLMEIAASSDTVTPQQALAYFTSPLPTATPGPLGVSPNVSQQFRTLQAECLPGYGQALASSFRDGPLRNLEKAFTTISETSHMKALIIHGTADSTVLYKFGLKIKELIPNAEVSTIEGAGHDLVVADGYREQVQIAILEFLKR